MKLFNARLIAFIALATSLAAMDTFHTTASAAQAIPISENPLFVSASQPPLNMLVLGRDHKLFTAAYNDASDLNGDGTIDVGYKGYLPATSGGITYYGYFDSGKCYSYSGGVFTPTTVTTTKQCPGSWSGDFLNYLSTSRIDALRKVLYGGTRSTDSTTQTILERAYIPQDGHAFGKEYQSIQHDGYDIHDYTPYNAPGVGRYMLFANTTLISSVYASSSLRNPNAPPLLRVMNNSPFRIWNWVAIEGPVSGVDCFTSTNSRVDCLSGGGANTTWTVVPATSFSGLTKTQFSLLPQQSNNQSPDQTGMNRLFPPSVALNGATRIQCGSGPAANIDGSGNQFKGLNSCANNDDNYLTEFAGNLIVPATAQYQFAVDGDDAVEAYVDGTLVASWYGPHGDCGYCNTHSGAALTLTAGTHTVLFRHQELGGGDNYRLLWLPPGAAAATRDDYTVRVQVCKTGLLEDNCEKYTDASNNVSYKPTGLMHDYGESDKMMFGLISGSYMHNHQGGVVRKQMGSFKDEVNAATGQFVTPKKGLIATFDGLKIQSLQVPDNSVYDNPHHDWNCSAGWSANQPDGSCRVWGNPIGEMMFETLRYFAGAAAPEPEYKYTDSGSDDNVLGIPEVATWKDPYKSIAQGGGGYPVCAKPFETVVSDVNPSYDSELPGNSFGVTAPSGTVPAALSGLNVSTLGGTIWNNEFGGPKNIYIGQVGSLFDSAPTSKTASTFGNIRGLSPEEPTKQGTYYSASVAYYGNTHPVSSLEGAREMQTFSVALSSPLPRIEFPGTTGTVTLVPFAKTVSGVGVDPAGAFQPTNQIVGFYVEKIANLPGAPTDVTVNGGLPYAKFRLSYEDAEQGNDYDMDAISSYEISQNNDATHSISVHMKSEYAAGSANQHMGYVISGSDHDGVYLEVVDVADGSSSTPSSATLYRLNTPPGLLPGDCGVTTPPAACNSLPLDTTRTFHVGTNAAAQVLKDPLWFAAKYGGFTDSNADAGTRNNPVGSLPDLTSEWDTDGDGVPDNYFLVTNALGLKAQLQRAFDSIIAAAHPVGSVAASGSRFVIGGSLGYEAKFRNDDWTGDLEAHELLPDGSLDPGIDWSANDKLPAPAARTVFIGKARSTGCPGTGCKFDAVPFTTAGIGPVSPASPEVTALMAGLDASFTASDVIAYLRGDQSKEVGQTNGFYRKRTTKIGDILDSNPTVAFKTGYGYQNLPVTVSGQATGSGSYESFVTAKSATPTVFVGANDGMLHAFDGSAAGGNELFSYIPNAVLPKLNRLTQPSYVHTYYVNGAPVIGDAYVGGWKTVLLESTGAGARSVFALDVTDPTSFSASSLMWEFNDQVDADMGTLIGSPSAPFITADGKWATAIGNGYNSASNKAILFVRDISDGSSIAKIDTGVGTAADPNGLSTAAIADSDADGTGDVIYAGDYQGNLWKFSCTPDTTAISATHPVHICTQPWHLDNSNRPLYTATDSFGHRQPITSGIFAIHNPLGGTLVYFGTGKYLATADADPNHLEADGHPLVNSIYAVWDAPANSATITKTELKQQTITGYTADGFVTVSQNLFDYDTTTSPRSMGWYLDLTTGLSPDGLLSDRVLAAPTGILGALLVNTFRPKGDICVPGGTNTFFELDLLNGSAAFSELSGNPPPVGTGGTDIPGSSSPLGTPNPVISIPQQPGIPNIGCPAGNPNCVTPPPSWCTATTPGYPNCAPPPWCPASDPAYPNCTPPAGCTPATPGFPYAGACAVGGAGSQCKWIQPGTPVGNQVACRVSWRQLR